MKKIILTQGKIVLIDDEDFELVQPFKWHTHKGYNNCYAAATVYEKDGKRKTILMHRLIMNVSQSMYIDHINHNGLDNRKINLRLATNSQNQANQRPYLIDKSSIWRGVSWNKQTNKWFVKIEVKRKQFFLGRYVSDIEAAQAYDNAAKVYFGEYAQTNF